MSAPQSSIAAADSTPLTEAFFFQEPLLGKTHWDWMPKYRRAEFERLMQAVRENMEMLERRTSPSATATLSKTEINDALDIAECAVHDQIRDPTERDWVKDILTKLRSSALQASADSRNSEAPK